MDRCRSNAFTFLIKLFTIKYNARIGTFKTKKSPSSRCFTYNNRRAGK